MKKVIQEAIEEQSLTPEELEEEAAFEAGFNATDVTPVAVESTTETPEEKEEPQETPAEEVKETPAEKTITLEDLNAALLAQKQDMQRINDKVFGKVGELQQKIDAMKGAAAGFSPKVKARLQENFPELAEMLFEDAEEVEATPAAPAVSAAPAVATPPATNDDPTALEKRLLKRDHPDWEQVVTTEDFATWRNTHLAPELAAELKISDDADFVSARLTEFKAWLKAKGTATDEERERQERLESGVIPKGKPKQGLNISDDDEEAAMLAAFGKR